MHPKHLKGDWEWDKHHDAGEEMLAGITLTEEDYGTWPDESDHHLSKITLHPSDFENETRSPGVASQSSALSSGRSAVNMMRSDSGKKMRSSRARVTVGGETRGNDPTT